VSYRLAATGNASQTALESGHDQAVLFKHYRELVRPKGRRAVFLYQTCSGEFRGKDRFDFGRLKFVKTGFAILSGVKVSRWKFPHKQYTRPCGRSAASLALVVQLASRSISGQVLYK
jgi:hypothetical protein